MSAQHPHDKVALTVVRGLIAAARVFGCGVIFLVWTATRYEGEVDPGVVALISGVSTLAGAAMGALGSILASTGKGTPQPVTVENSPAAPVPTADVPQPGPISPARPGEFGHADPAGMLVIAATSVIVVTLYHLLIKYA